MVLYEKIGGGREVCEGDAGRVWTVMRCVIGVTDEFKVVVGLH